MDRRARAAASPSPIRLRWHRTWEPFWQAVDEVQLPSHFHSFPTTPLRARQQAPQVRRAAMFTRRLGVSDGADPHHSGMMGAGVFERCPNLRAFGGSGASWLAYALHRMDFEFEGRFRDLTKLKPSEYWRRQYKATLQFEAAKSLLCGAR